MNGAGRGSAGSLAADARAGRRTDAEVRMAPGNSHADPSLGLGCQLCVEEALGQPEQVCRGIGFVAAGSVTKEHNHPADGPL